MPDFSPWGSSAMSGAGNWNPPAPAAPTPPAASPAPSSPGFDVSPPGGLGGSSPPAPNLPGGSSMTVPQNGQPGMDGGMTMNAPGSNASGAPRPPMPATGVAYTQPGGGAIMPQTVNGGLAQQQGVSGLGPLLQLLMGGGGASGSNPIMSLLQMLSGRGNVQQAGMPSNTQGIANRSQGWVNNRMDPNWVAQRVGGQAIPTLLGQGPSGGGINSPVPPASVPNQAGDGANRYGNPAEPLVGGSNQPDQITRQGSLIDQLAPPARPGGGGSLVDTLPQPQPAASSIPPYSGPPIPNLGPTLTAAQPMATALGMQQSQNPVLQGMAPLLLQQLLGRRA